MAITRNKQNAVLKNPIPVIIGNVSLQPSGANEYYYLSSYIVQQNDIAEANVQDGIVFYDHFTKKWRMSLIYSEMGLKSANIRKLFPFICGNLSGIGDGYYMNPFVNINGYPTLDGKRIYGEDQYIYYDESFNTWMNGRKVFSFPLSGVPATHDPVSRDIADLTFGGAGPYGDDFYSVPLSSLQDGKCYLDPSFAQRPLLTGDIRVPSSFLNFENKFYRGNYAEQLDNVTGYILPPQNSFCKTEDSPPIIMGEECLGFYNNDDQYNPYVIGSICIGTEGNTVPPIIGTSKPLSIDCFEGVCYYTPTYYDFRDHAYTLIGTSFDETKEKWRLYKLETSLGYFVKTGFSEGTYILLSGDLNNDPFFAEQYWYYDPDHTVYNLFSYSELKNGITFLPGHSGGSQINIKIVGITGLSFDQVAHPRKCYRRAKFSNIYRKLVSAASKLELKNVKLILFYRDGK